MNIFINCLQYNLTYGGFTVDLEKNSDVTLARWARSLKRQSTRNAYTTNVLVYSRYLKLSPTELKEEAKEQ